MSDEVNEQEERLYQSLRAGSWAEFVGSGIVSTRIRY